MKIETYDYVCSIGSSCLCATVLREAGLRLSSGPFDWLTGTDFRSRIGLIVGDFADWMEKDDFRLIGRTQIGAHDSYENIRTGLRFLHDFDSDRPFEACYDGVREKYERRIARFYERIRASRRVLLVWVENPLAPDAPTSDDVEWGREALGRKFPGVRIELLVIEHSSETVPSTGGIVLTHGYWRAACPFRKPVLPGQTVYPWDVELPPLLLLLEAVKASDYRSAGERRSRRAERWKSRYALVGARNFPDYLVARLEVKVCKLFLRRLLRRGCDFRRVFELQLAAILKGRESQ